MTITDRTGEDDATFEALLARVEAADEAPESVRERLTETLLLTVLGTDDDEMLTGCDLPADEIARLIRDHAADAALGVLRGEGRQA